MPFFFFSLRVFFSLYMPRPRGFVHRGSHPQFILEEKNGFVGDVQSSSSSKRSLGKKNSAHLFLVACVRPRYAAIVVTINSTSGTPTALGTSLDAEPRQNQDYGGRVGEML